MSEPLDCRTGPDLARTVVRFCRALREEGLAVPVSSVQSYARALGALGARSAADVYWAGRATLVLRPEDTPSYDRVFCHLLVRRDSRGPRTPRGEGADGDEGWRKPPRGASPGAERQRQLRYSRAEMLRHKDFSACSEEELAEAMELLRWRPAISCRPSHRWRARAARSPAGRAGYHAPRHALRRRGGPHQAPRALAPRPPARGLVRRQRLDGTLRPRHVALRPRPRGRAVPRRSLRHRDTPHATDAGAVVSRPRCGHDDRGSGGAGLVGRVRDSGRACASSTIASAFAGMARGAEVIVMSDGWDRGDPEELGAQMSRLHRVAHRVVWMNPLKADPAIRAAGPGHGRRTPARRPLPPRPRHGLPGVPAGRPRIAMSPDRHEPQSAPVPNPLSPRERARSRCV